jgi:hypothetical protein
MGEWEQLYRRKFAELRYPFCLPVFSILTRKTPNTDFSEDATGGAER